METCQFYNSKNQKIEITVKDLHIELIKNKKIEIDHDNFLGCRIYKQKENTEKQKIEFYYFNVIKKKFKKYNLKEIIDREIVNIELMHDDN